MSYKMADTPRLSAKEQVILRSLITDGPAYGLELVRRCSNDLPRGTVYVTLARMTDAPKRYVTSKLRAPPKRTKGPHRREYRATPRGRQVFAAWTAYLTALTTKESA